MFTLEAGGFRSVGTLCLRCKQKTLSPMIGERAVAIGTCLVVQVSFGRCRLVEVARRTNRLLARIWPRKAGGHVPVEMVDRVRVFGVGLGQLAGEDLRLLLHPSRLQGLDRRAVCCVD